MGDTRGLIWTADTIKLHRLALTRYLAGHPLSRPSGIGLTSDGLPKLLPSELRDLIREGNFRAIALGLTLLSCSRVILGGKPVDTEAIKKEWKGKSDIISQYIPDFLTHFGIKPFKTTWKQFHWSTKGSPSGPALVSALLSWRLLPQELKKDHISLGGSAFGRIYQRYEQYTDAIWTDLESHFPIKRNLIRKLSVKADREGKSRVFAMLDYYSQTVLKTIHDNLFQGLRRIPMDRTFVQAEGLDLGKPSDHYHSLDLSSATDRFPMQLQQKLIAALIGRNKAAAWARILVKYPYDLNGEQILYRTGQPMGAYSSWPAFTMTHHLLVYAAAREVGLTNFTGYALLGDDIVICHDQVADKYREFLQILDVPISEQKSHVSKDTFEFAKRWFYRGLEVSPFPLSGLQEVSKKYFLLLELLRAADKRGFCATTSPLRVPGQLVSLLRNFGIVGRLARTYIWKFQLASNIPLAGDDVYEVHKKALAFCGLAGTRLSCNLRFAEVARIFERHAADVLAGIMEDEAERIEEKSFDWLDRITSELQDLTIGPADQAELLDEWRVDFPVFATLSKKSTDAWQSMNDASACAYAEDGSIWDVGSRITLLNMPGIDGINPTRASYQIAGARATWSVTLAKSWKDYEQGVGTELKAFAIRPTQVNMDDINHLFGDSSLDDD